MSKFAQLGIWEATRDGCGILQPQLLLNKSGTNQEMPRSAVPVANSRIHATRRSASAAPPAVLMAPVALPTTALATLAPSGTFLALLNDSDSKLKRRSEDDIPRHPRCASCAWLLRSEVALSRLRAPRATRKPTPSSRNCDCSSWEA